LIKLINFDFDQTLYATKLEGKIENKIYIAVMEIGDRSRCVLHSINDWKATPESC
jgi:hypothetical protein